MTENTSETSLRDELATAYDAANATADAPLGDAPPGDAPPPAAGEVPPADGLTPPPSLQLPPLEAPAMWGQQYKETFAQLAQTPEQRAVAERWLEQWKETQGYITKRDQEYADYRKRLDPIYQQIAPFEQVWQMQGLTPDQGVGRLMAYARALEENPAAMIPQLAQMYGVDLHQLIAEQPYVDPEVQALRDQLAQVQQSLQHDQQTRQQMELQQQHAHLTQQVTAFAQAKDEQGNPKHPHFDRVYDRMVGLARGGLAQGLDEAYRMAVSLDPELQAEIQRNAAMQQAATLSADAKRATDASRTVRSNDNAQGAAPPKSLRDDLAEGLAGLGYGS